MSAGRIGRAFSPANRLAKPTQGVALGWYDTGPLALGIRQAPRAKDASPSFFRAKGAWPYQPGASPQEWNHPTKQRAESPIHGIAACDVGYQFRGVTKMIMKGIGRAFSPRETVSTRFLGRCPRLVWRWAFGPETQTAPTARFHTSLGQRPRYMTPTQIEG